MTRKATPNGAARRARASIAIVALLLFATSAAAQDGGVPDAGAPTLADCPLDHVGCHRASVDFHHREAFFDDVMLDSGWVPAGAPVQVRFALFIGGSTEVDLGGTAVTSWPPALAVAVPGRPGTGRLRMSYGIEIVARARFDVEVAGVRYTWEGDIPIPGGIPSDLRLADERVFDPFVLPPMTPRPVTIWDDTDRITVLEVDVTDAIIPIPGIGGGFLVDAVASLEGSYRTDRIEVGDAALAIEEEGASVVVRPDPGALELGAAKDLEILPVGTIGYDGVVTLYPTLFLEIAGRRFDLVLADVPLNVVDLERETMFEPAMVHVPLPDIRVQPMSLGFMAPAGGEDEQLLTVFNDGEATLTVTPGVPSGPFSHATPSLVLPPRSSGQIAISFTPVEPGGRPGVLLLASDDPDEPLVTVQLYGTAEGTAFGDADVGALDAGVGPGASIDGGCGCRVSARPGISAPLLALLPALLLARRRRR